jgi:hypothetical protein
MDCPLKKRTIEATVFHQFLYLSYLANLLKNPPMLVGSLLSFFLLVSAQQQKKTLPIDWQAIPLSTCLFSSEGKFEYMDCDGTEHKGQRLEQKLWLASWPFKIEGGSMFFSDGRWLKGLFVPMALAEMLSYKLLSTEAAVFSIYALRKGVPVLAALARAAQLPDTVNPAVVIYILYVIYMM